MDAAAGECADGSTILNNAVHSRQAGPHRMVPTPSISVSKHKSAVPVHERHTHSTERVGHKRKSVPGVSGGTFLINAIRKLPCWQSAH